jgi:holo-[acyl-carrier protein] synthase
MAMRVGIDLVSIDSVKESIREHGARYLERIYTEQELRDCRTDQGIVAERLAARFAAKEATIKVLRPPGGEAVPWQTMGVVRHSSGWVAVELSGRAAALAAEAGLSDFALSISHEAGFASAVVIAEQAPGKQPDEPTSGARGIGPTDGT